MKFTIHSIHDLKGVANHLVAKHDAPTIFLLEGPMGAGKTTFVKTFCEVVGINDGVSSPTFSLVNEYIWKDRKILHFDLYRINNPLELLDIGFEDMLDQAYYTFVEWPSKAGGLVPNGIRLIFTIETNTIRTIEVI